MRSADAEVVVVGAGVMGLATARALRRAGRDVLVLEQFELGHTRGSSHGGSRIVRLSYPAVEWVRLAQEAYPLWHELEAECGEQLLELHGTLDLGGWEANRDALTACGVPCEVLDAAEVDRRFGIRLEPGEHGLYQADGGVAYADKVMRALGAAVHVREGTRVDSIEERDGGVVVDDVFARAAVVTVGAWAPTLVQVDATPTLETTSYFSLSEPMPSVIDTLGGADHGYALVAPGVGLKAGLHQSGPAVDPEAPASPDSEIAERTADWVQRRFPRAGERAGSETCFYTRRANDEFLLERRGRVVVGSPCSGHGFKFAPVVGRRLAALAADVL